MVFSVHRIEKAEQVSIISIQTITWTFKAQTDRVVTSPTVSPDILQGCMESASHAGLQW